MLVKAAAHLGVVAIAAGWEHSVLLTADANVFTFGRGVGANYQSMPTQVFGVDIEVRNRDQAPRVTIGRGVHRRHCHTAPATLPPAPSPPPLPPHRCKAWAGTWA